MIIALALVVTLLLIGGIVYVYMASNNFVQTPKTPTTSQNSKTPETTKTSVTTSDVDTATQEIDKAVGDVNETRDLSANDVSDQTLGL
jgi:flagellar basal body-associated protein FliL